MGSFSQGYGMGVQMFNAADASIRADKEAERQARLDAMREEEHGKRMNVLDGQIGDAQQVRDQAAERAKAGQDVVATEGAAVVGPNGKASMQPDATTAQAAIDQARAEGDETQYAPVSAGVVKAGGAGSKTFLAADGGIDAANKYAGSQNTPDAKYDRVAAIIDKQNPTAGMEFRKKADDYKLERYKAGMNVLMRDGLNVIYNKGANGLADWYGHYQDGYTAKAQENPDGSGAITAFSADGKPSGTIKYKDKDDLALQFRNMVDPEKAVAAYAAQRAEAAKEATRVHAIGPGYELRNGAGSVVGSNTTPTAAQLHYGPGGSGANSTKMNEEDKIVFKDSAKRVDDAERYQREAMLKLQPGEDPEKNPAIVDARKSLAAAKINHYKTSINLGIITPGAVVDQVIGVAKTPADVMKSLNELGQTVGTDFTDQVSELISQTDAWKAMSSKTNSAVAASPAKSPAMTNAQIGAKASNPAPASNQKEVLLKMIQGKGQQEIRAIKEKSLAEVQRLNARSDPNAKARIDELNTLLGMIDRGQY